MAATKTQNKAFKVQTLAWNGNPGWTLRVMARDLADARAKFARENPGVDIYSVARWTGRENR